MRSIVVGIPAVPSGNVLSYATALTRALRDAGADTSLLVTEPGDKITGDDGAAFDRLPQGAFDDLSDQWLGLLRYLEERAPCVYLSNQDWTSACVTPRLSSRVIAVGVLHDDSAAENEQCFRLAAHWNAVVALNDKIRQRVMVEHQMLASRLASVGSAESIGWQETARQYIALFERLEGEIHSGAFRRRRSGAVSPPASAFERYGFSSISRAMRFTNAIPMWPDPPKPVAPSVSPSVAPAVAKLSEHTIVLSIPTGRISGVDVFAVNLARGLAARGYKAEIVKTSPPGPIPDELSIPHDVPVVPLALRPHPTWKERWAALRTHLETRSPCIYVPNYDTRHSCIAPTLKESVRVAGIAHSDDPHHYDHIARLESSWDGVVGVSSHISTFIRRLAPSLESRLVTIPYGVNVPAEFPQSEIRRDPTLRVVYAGRMSRYQKRVMDLVTVGHILRERGVNAEITLAGDGADTPILMQAIPDLVLSRHIRLVGGVSNDTVLKLFSESDIFVLPSSFEGLPVSLLEAMAHGCVPVVTGIPSGIPEVVVHGVNGFIVPVAEPAEMAARLEMLSRDSAMLAGMKRAAYETVRDRGYSIDSMTSRYIEFFEHVVLAPRNKRKGRMKRAPELSRLDQHMPRLPLPIRRAAWSLTARLGGSR